MYLCIHETKLDRFESFSMIKYNDAICLMTLTILKSHVYTNLIYFVINTRL